MHKERMGLASELCLFLRSMPMVSDCSLYGSLAEGRADIYSDIDIKVDVSGADNAAFALALPDRLRSRYNPIFVDYAPSLMPDKYVFSAALSSADPFLIADICCVATPHVPSLNRSDFPFDPYDHALKLFVANLKHMLRGNDCIADVQRMAARLFGEIDAEESAKALLARTFAWLSNAEHSRYSRYLLALCPFVAFL